MVTSARSTKQKDRKEVVSISRVGVMAKIPDKRYRHSLFPFLPLFHVSGTSEVQHSFS